MFVVSTFESILFSFLPLLRLCTRVPQACDTPHARIERMLKMLPRRGSDAYDKFIKVLLSMSHGHVAKKLRVTEGMYITTHIFLAFCIVCPSLCCLSHMFNITPGGVFLPWGLAPNPRACTLQGGSTSPGLEYIPRVYSDTCFPLQIQRTSYLRHLTNNNR